MKTISKLLLILTVIVFAGCEGDTGPMGPPGEDGYNILGTVFETTGTFNEANQYTLSYVFPDDFQVYDGDAVVVYILWDVVDGLDVWRALPQTIFLESGAFQYNFDYTTGDVQIFIDGELDPALLGPGNLVDQTFRIAVIPADLYKNKSIDITNYNEVTSAMLLWGGKINKAALISQ
jgi:hypothetical protein